jgi:uncharacterized OB-fold protein
MPEYTKPVPVPNMWTKAYWDGAREHKLLITRCAKCGRYTHPPLQACPQCGSEEMRPAPVSGKGTIYSYSIMHQVGNPGFEKELPYAVVIVELAEQKGLYTVSNLRDCPIGQIRIGMPVEVLFEDVTPEVTLPQFRPAKGGR